MPNQFMLAYYRDQAAALASAREDQADLVAQYTYKLANSTPTPTADEMHRIASGEAVTLSGDGTPPAHNTMPRVAHVRARGNNPTKI